MPRAAPAESGPRAWPSGSCGDERVSASTHGKALKQDHRIVSYHAKRKALTSDTFLVQRLTLGCTERKFMILQVETPAGAPAGTVNGIRRQPSSP